MVRKGADGGGRTPPALPRRRELRQRGAAAGKNNAGKSKQRQNNDTSRKRNAGSRLATTVYGKRTVINTRDGVPTALDYRHRVDGVGAVPPAVEQNRNSGKTTTRAAGKTRGIGSPQRSTENALLSIHETVDRRG